MPTVDNTCSLYPSLFVNHGGGPLPLIGRQDDLARHMSAVVTENLPRRPSAIVVVSAHYEGDPIQITSGSNPDLLFDYYGFPKETYEYKYPAPGDPALAQRIKDNLEKEGLESELDSKRGWDHGVFVPLLLMFPEANIPVVSVSLHKSLDPDKNMAIGRALSPLRQEDVLVLGSGYTFHNMHAFFNPEHATKKASLQFNDWLKSTIIDEGNFEKLKEWKQAPSARICHPREEHLLPLLVVAGAAGDSGAGELIYDTRSQVNDHAVTGYLFK
ncbi:DOPA dioxygenase extradiol [Seminavis robusta]|uniref:DOPA dioxygenase extradiol n=1 Tax=Seminavis robusta TaxID=568900 RepID=A0A9N8H911_9STRA|nr:DOPA dioxygenase extradiol [Seminavis robusta]|eukprot:Sro176_g077250.1 DOPA dioxygenase extradiol (271) ;mRNA; r:14861-15779